MISGTILIGCRTTDSSVIQIPPLTVERPERPYLDGTYEDMVRQLIVYGMQMDEYCDRLETYIDEVNRILNEG